MKFLIILSIALFISSSLLAQEKPARTDVHSKKNLQVEKVQNEHPGHPATAKNQGKKIKEKDNQANEKVAIETNNNEDYSDFPKYIDTGNPQQDKTNYYNAKKAWATAHPEAYKKISGNRSYVEPSNNR